MKERPILFTPENAQKVFEGNKTQTRRLNKLAKVNETPNDWGVLPHHDDSPLWQFIHGNTLKRTSRSWSIKCPYGVVGDRMWIREAWSPCNECFLEVYKGQGVRNCPCCDTSTAGLKFIPSIHMHRTACRTVVELTDVRVERVQEISEKDCIAEGCGSPITRDMKKPNFMRLWESINGTGSWALNPWVWVLTMRKVES